MGLQYRKGKVTLNFREDKPEAYKLIQLTYPQVTYRQLIAECATACNVSPAQTKVVVDALVDRMVLLMGLGHGVQLGAFGTFRPTFNSKVAKSLEKATLDKTLKVKKIQFYPGRDFKEMLESLPITAASEALNVKEDGEQAPAQADGE